MTDQFKRAGTSIVLNIAEGSGQPTIKGFSLYLNRSKASVLECVVCSKISIQEGFATEKDFENLQNLMKEEYFKLIALEKSIHRQSFLFHL